MIEIVKNKTLAVTGHRKIQADLDLEKLEKVFLDQIENGIDTFLVGMAIGFDILCFQVLEKIRLTKNIKIIACIPCADQSKKFSFNQKLEYNRALESADDKIYISQSYTPYCMMKRNMFMVDNSSVLVCYLRENKGGTYNTVKYAKTQGLNIINV